MDARLKAVLLQLRGCCDEDRDAATDLLLVGGVRVAQCVHDDAQQLEGLEVVARGLHGSGDDCDQVRLSLEQDLALVREEPKSVVFVRPAGARARTANAVLRLSERGIRSGLVRMPRTVHGRGDRNGLITNLVGLDWQLGVAAYVGDGRNRWPAVHIGDAGRLFRLALERAPAGCVLHAVGEEGVPMGDVAAVIASKTGLPASAVDPESLGLFGALLGGDQPASGTATRRLLGWEPTGPTLLEDLAAGYYTC
jgi:nucleoside-diphosphate-sugar epimerase